MNVMTEDPIKTVGDHLAVSVLPYEPLFPRSRFHEEFPDKNAAQIKEAIRLAKLSAGPSEPREKIEQLVREYLSQ